MPVNAARVTSRTMMAHSLRGQKRHEGAGFQQPAESHPGLPYFDSRADCIMARVYANVGDAGVAAARR